MITVTMHQPTLSRPRASQQQSILNLRKKLFVDERARPRKSLPWLPRLRSPFNKSRQVHGYVSSVTLHTISLMALQLVLVSTFLHQLGQLLPWQCFSTVTLSLYCLIEEIPHEVGDFAILVQSGFTKYQAILSQ
jgi:hypothetical protein